MGYNNTCYDSVCVRVIILSTDCDETDIYIPTAFSPNGDGQNEELCIYGGHCASSVVFSIYDRWGNIIYHSTNPNKCWDGSYNSKKLNTGVFVFKADFVFSNGESKSVSGNVSLIR